MTALPRYDPSEVATRSDVASLRSDVDSLRSDVGELRSEVGVLRSEVGVLRSDVGVLRSEVGVLRSDLDMQRSDLASLRVETREGLAAVNQRLDRLYLTLLVGMFTMAAALVGVMFRLG